MPSSSDGTVISRQYMTEIERILNDGMTLRNISDADQLRHNDDNAVINLSFY